MGNATLLCTSVPPTPSTRVRRREAGGEWRRCRQARSDDAAFRKAQNDGMMWTAPSFEALLTLMQKVGIEPSNVTRARLTEIWVEGESVLAVAGPDHLSRRLRCRFAFLCQRARAPRGRSCRRRRSVIVTRRRLR